MTPTDKINNAIKAAMKAKEAARLRTLRAIKSAILLANTDGSGQEMTDERFLKIVQKLSKQRQDSLDIFRQQNREDLASKEEEELVVLKEYLPKQLDPAELETIVKEIIQKVGANSMKDMGKVMGLASKQLAGKADGKAISILVKQLLS